jgi:PilZ domain
MTTSPVCVERRMGQRFAFNLPVSLRDVATSAEGRGFTQNLSSRGVFLFTDMALNEGAEVELTLRMPSEITLGENMRVRCRGRVLRVSVETASAETKIGLAVCFNGYEYLPESEDSSADFRRISALHGGSETDRTAVPLSAIPRTATH